MKLIFQECAPTDTEAEPLLPALSAELFRITGNDGTQFFSDDDVRMECSVFLVAMDGENLLVVVELCPLK